MKTIFKISLKMLLGLAFLITFTSGKVAAQNKSALDRAVIMEIKEGSGISNYLFGLRLRYGSYSVKSGYEEASYLVDSNSQSRQYGYNIISSRDTLIIIPLDKKLLTNNKPCLIMLYQINKIWFVEEDYNSQTGSFYIMADSISEKNPRANWELLMKRLETWHTIKIY